LSSPKTYRIGTRGSLLALTQCGQIKDQLEALTQDRFELVVIKTQGDLVTNAPLWQLDGKDFFTKELDAALLAGEIDLVVHSYKDLGSERPSEINLAAITKRTFAHDILLIKKSTVEKLCAQKLEQFTIGTSSPRRMANLKEKFKDFLPFGSKLTIDTKVLRGNVNTRIEKLNHDEFDAIVLALPGIERLAQTASSAEILTKLCRDLTFMVLPQSEFPSAASQGALGIECLKDRNDRGELLQKLALLNDQTTIDEVVRERKAFKAYGGGCHLAVGINVKKVQDYFIHHHSGQLDARVEKHFVERSDLTPLKEKMQLFIGLPKHHDGLLKKSSTAINCDLKHKNLFISSKHVIDQNKNVLSQAQSLWSSGIANFKELARLGFFINGCADSLGLTEVTPFLKSRAIQILLGETTPRLFNLTAVAADATQIDGIWVEAIQAYERHIDEQWLQNENNHSTLLNFDVFYWSSFYQYQVYSQHFPLLKNKRHACGLGKTYRQFCDHNISVTPFYHYLDCQKWCDQKLSH